MAEDVTAIPTPSAGQLKGKTVDESRIEEDLLGAKEVPIGAYYGIHTVRAMENFRISSATVGDVPEMAPAREQRIRRRALTSRGSHPADTVEAGGEQA